MKLLVSVVDAAEARLAVAGGVDIVDVKNPAEGSLGAPAPGVIAQVRDVLPAELPLSAALGDLPCLPGTAALAALGAARSGAAYVKLGLWGVTGTEDAVAVLRAARDAVDGEAAVIAVAYADAARVPSRPLAPSELVAAAREAGVSGCLIDTAIKDGRGLLSWLAADALAELVAEAHGAGLEIALAGELRAEDLPAVRATGADIAGVRSAACREGRRTAALDPARIARAAGGVRGRDAAPSVDGELRIEGVTKRAAPRRRSEVPMWSGVRLSRIIEVTPTPDVRWPNRGHRPPRTHSYPAAVDVRSASTSVPAVRPVVEQLGEPRRLAAVDHPRLDAGGPQRGGQMLVDPRGPQRGELVDGEPRDRLAGRRPGAVEARDRLQQHEALGAGGAGHPRGDRVRGDGPRLGERVALRQQRGRQQDRDDAVARGTRAPRSAPHPG